MVSEYRTPATALASGTALQRRICIGFWRFLRYGAVITTVDLAVGFGLLATERALGVPRWGGLG